MGDAARDCGYEPSGAATLLKQSRNEFIMAKTISLDQALAAATDTRRLEIDSGACHRTPRIFQELFGDRQAVIIADANTFAAAGETVLEAFRAARVPMLPPFIFRAPDLYAEHDFVGELQLALRKHLAIPIAVGSGTINDLTKLAAHRADRPYICVATAASMDGYTAFGASITHEGSKQTFMCPAPAAVIADLDVIAAAPAPMNSWGYADLIAKATAGADWLIADALGIERIIPEAWEIVQGRLRECVAQGIGVAEGDTRALRLLVEGLMLSGFAMQAAKSSRPASGAEHQFSHLWDMQNHTHNGSAPSHGFKVGIGTLAVTALYESLLRLPLDQLDFDGCCAAWPGKVAWRGKIRAMFGEDELSSVALKETLAKADDPEQIRRQLMRLRGEWPQLRERIREQLIPFGKLKQMLSAVGAPTGPEQIGISRSRLRDSFLKAYCIRRRFTVLDIAVRADILDGSLNQIFGEHGAWPVAKSRQVLAER